MKDIIPSRPPIHIITASDLHMLSGKLNDKGDTLHRTSLRGDGKVLPYSAEIIEAFIDQVLAEQPDLLVLTGDLSFNGERQSHLDLIEHLSRVQAAGIPVNVIPGNHDIAMAYAAEFSEGKAWKTSTVTWSEFYDLYRAFGYEQALQRDTDSFSYVTPLSDQLWLALIDVNTQDHPGRVAPATLTWLESVLTSAAGQGITVITATHQSILVHNERFTQGFIINNHQTLEELLTKYGVRFNLSGHIHMQHLVLQPKGLSEAATGAVSASPHPLAHVRIDADLNLDYQTDAVDVSAWALKSGHTDPNLLGFAAFSRQYFYGISASKTGAQLMEQADLEKSDLIDMAEFSAAVNTAYFEGRLSELLQDPKTHPGYLLWKEKGQEHHFWDYLNSFLLKPLKDETRATISLKAPIAPSEPIPSPEE